MFSLFKKKQAQSEPPLKKKIKDMKCRKINYVDEGFDTLASEMSADPKAILRLKPVNYYAIKNKYIMGKVYTSEDYQENYASFSEVSMTTSAEKLISSPCLRSLCQRLLQRWA